ncbi:MIP-related peptide [Biomphalaria glabrata]|nr:MIP-related peptide [Biomphalaria glabrata]
MLYRRLSPLAVLISSFFLSCVIADSLDAAAAQTDQGASTYQARQQQREPTQQQLNPSSLAASDSRYFHSLLNDGVLADNFVVDTRAIPRFVGKKDISSFSDEMDRMSRAIPRFVGKKRANEEVSSGIQTDAHRVEKRSAARRIYVARGAPYFIGKRYTNYRTSKNVPSSPYLSAQEFKATFRRTDPYFMGKRASDFDDAEEEFPNFDERGAPRFVGKRGAPRFVGKRDIPRFVGKRAPPRFVGKRDPPRFVGKRDPPRFVGKRDPPRFVGKREEDDLIELYEPRESYEFGSDAGEQEGVYPALPILLDLIKQREAEDEAAARRQEAIELIQARLQNADELLQAERASRESHTEDSSADETGVRR